MFSEPDVLRRGRDQGYKQQNLRRGMDGRPTVDSSLPDDLLEISIGRIFKRIYLLQESGFEHLLWRN